MCAFLSSVSCPPPPALTPLLRQCTAEDLAKWQRLDDVIMGGKSSSAMELGADGAAVWKGDLIVEVRKHRLAKKTDGSLALGLMSALPA